MLLIGNTARNDPLGLSSSAINIDIGLLWSGRNSNSTRSALPTPLEVSFAVPVPLPDEYKIDFSSAALSLRNSLLVMAPSSLKKLEFWKKR